MFVKNQTFISSPCLGMELMLHLIDLAPKNQYEMRSVPSSENSRSVLSHALTRRVYPLKGRQKHVILFDCRSREGYRMNKLTQKIE